MSKAGREDPARPGPNVGEPLLGEDDQVCLEQGFTSCRPQLLRLCRAILRDEVAAEDAIQDAYVRAHSSWRQFDGVNLTGWLYRIAQRTCLDRIRESLPNARIANRNEHFAKDGEIPLVTAIEIRTILARLPENQRLCLKLFYIEGYSAKEVAGATGFTDKQVKSYLQNGRRNFTLEWESMKRRDG